MHCRLIMAFYLAVLGSAHAMSLDEAIRRAVKTNPQIGEASASRRATEQELRQSQGALLPQVKATAYFGREQDRRLDLPVATGANDWKDGRQVGLVATQLLFDGFSTINQIYRQMARAEGAAWRVQERAELVALDTVEAYLDILRYEESILAVNASIATYRNLSGKTSSRFSGGRAGKGDLQQVTERLNGAIAMRQEFVMRLEEAKAAYRRSVGAEPKGLKFPSRLSVVPRSREEALKLALGVNPTIRAAKSDVEAARKNFDAAAGAYGPKIYLEGRASAGADTNSIQGRYDQASVRAVASWDLYSGGTDASRRQELAERIGETEMKMSQLQRAAFQSIDRAWGTRAVSGPRIAALQSQLAAAQGVVQAYISEYEGGQKTLIDLLNSENAVLNSKISLASAKSLAVYSDYQLLAATGKLLANLKIAPPNEAIPVSRSERSVFPTNPIVIDPGSVPEREVKPYELF